MKLKFPQLFKLSAKRRKRVLPTLLGFLVTLILAAASVNPPQIKTHMTELLYDTYQRAAPREYKPDLGVRIVDIDEESIRRYGQWPWPRTLLADFNTRLSSAGAGVVAYDIIFSEADRTSPENLINIYRANPKAIGEFENITSLAAHDDIFASSIDKSNVILGFFLLNKPNEKRTIHKANYGFGGSDPTGALPQFAGAIPPLIILEEKARGTGFVSFHPGEDGIIREAPLMAKLDGRVYPALSIDALRAVQGASSYKIRGNDASAEQSIITSVAKEVTALQVGNFEVPTTANGGFRVHFTEYQPGRTIPAWKVLSDDPADSGWQDKINGHIVFIGTSAEGLKDLVATPNINRLAGVEVHAQVVEQILGEQYLVRPDYQTGVEMTALLGIGIVLSLTLPWLSAAVGAVFSVLLGAGIYFTSWNAFKEHQTLVDPVFMLLAVLSIYTLVTLLSFYLTETERSRIRSAFSMYLSPTMVKKVSEDPGLLTLGGEERNMTILFLDIRGFSKISHGLEPNEITTFLNIFLTPMTNILQEGKATIDKYIGDAIVAFWNAPLDDEQHEQNAARAVMTMMRSLDDLNEKYMAQSEIKWPDDVRMGIGLNTGICCVGNLGSEQRFSYSMIGDAANLAARIEGLTKQYKVHVLLGESTATKLVGFAIIEADLIQVVGRPTPERVFILAGEETEAGTAEYKALIPIHEKFLTAYRAQDWKTAEGLIPQLESLAKPLDFHGYYDVMRTRIAGYKKTPPPKDWGGVYVATSK